MSQAAVPSPWRVWLSAMRPATLLAAAVPVWVGTALAAADGGVRPWVAWAALCGAGCIQIGTNLFNDYADFKSGADTADRLGPARASQCGWLRPETVLRGAVVSFGLATCAGFWLLYLSGWPVVLMGVASILAGMAYTGGPYPLGYHGLGDAFVFVFFGLVAVCGTYYLQVGAVSGPCMGAAAAVGALATAILVVNNLRDRHTDAPAGKRTLAVRWGSAFARWQYAILVAGAYAATTLVFASGRGGVGWLLPLVTLPLAWQGVRRVWGTDGAALNPLLGFTARLEALFGALLGAGVWLCG